MVGDRGEMVERWCGDGGDIVGRSRGDGAGAEHARSTLRVSRGVVESTFRGSRGLGIGAHRSACTS